MVNALGTTPIGRAPLIIALALACWLSAASSWGLDENYYQNWMIAIAINSKEAPSQHTFDRGKKAQFKIQCIRGNMLISVSWNSSTSRRDQRSIQLRLDDKLVDASEWNHDSGRDESFFPGNPRKFVRRLMETRIFSIEYGKGFHNQEISATFDLSGLEKAIKPVQTICDI